MDGFSGAMLANDRKLVKKRNKYSFTIVLVNDKLTCKPCRLLKFYQTNETNKKGEK